MKTRRNIRHRTSNVERRMPVFSFTASAREREIVEYPARPRFCVRCSTFDVRRSSNAAQSRARRGLSLFEVIIALAIFMGAIAAIGQLISTGVRGAVQARLQSQAVLRAETKMAEIVSGSVGLHSSSSGGFPDNPAWTWSVSVAPSPHAGLYYVDVTAAHSAATAMGRQVFTLRRLMRDPQMALDAYAAQQQAIANGSTTGSSSTGSTGGSSGGTTSSSGSSK